MGEPCAVCGLPGTPRFSVNGEPRPVACSTECAVEAWAATWAVSADQRKYAAWSCRHRRAESRGESPTESPPLGAAERAWISFLMSNPRVAAHWKGSLQ